MATRWYRSPELLLGYARRLVSYARRSRSIGHCQAAPSFTNPLNPCWQGSLREGGGHVVGGLHLGRAERRAAPVPRRERDRPALHHPESVGTPPTRADEALL